MKLEIKIKALLFIILILAAVVRLYNINWDNGYHLHPDERAIVLSVIKLQFPHNMSEFLSPSSPWNPHFFAYGSFPFYLLKIAGDITSIINPQFGQYDGINLVGRVISAISDLVTIVLLFLLGKKIFTTFVGLLSSFFYSISVLPIQLSHFYAVDTLLTCFIVLALYLLIRFYEKPTVIKSLFIGLAFGFALATKISAVLLVSSIGITLVVDFILLFFKEPHRPHVWFPHVPKFLRHLLGYGLLIAISTLLTFLILEPYALIDFSNFWNQTVEQSQMTHNAFIFPYTLQYVNKISYFYELKNIFLFGEGPFISLFSFLGIIYFFLLLIRSHKKELVSKELTLFVFFLIYFAVVGKFAIGFMRYMLPLYPLFSLFAGLLCYRLILYLKQNRTLWLNVIIGIYVLLIFLIWPLSFLSIYNHPNTRFSASQWIVNTIPPGKKLAIEHWDDALPMFGQQQYTTFTLTLYDPDTPEKWNQINTILQQTDYIIIASNRLYVPLQKLTHCAILPSGRCYSQTAEYYKKLFSGQLGFKKIAEFTDYPIIPFFNIPINDQGADESFTVYDHPKVIIFQKNSL